MVSQSPGPCRSTLVILSCDCGTVLLTATFSPISYNLTMCFNTQFPLTHVKVFLRHSSSTFYHHTPFFSLVPSQRKVSTKFRGCHRRIFFRDQATNSFFETNQRQSAGTLKQIKSREGEQIVKYHPSINHIMIFFLNE